ncbi:MFS family permease [Anaerosolibacter carboniphilus]|uniref:MFS family permease n=1 Tax=Anaerosolibacter carboniphilus TaxID=1417629 RepID=A0A841KYF0_9FIRM|nr:DUF5693 family protein [Anaerosolibacter carboniphilus]MBB6218806.1 MFS family permease [Anaerosolibacter carboniphilus]
MKKNGIILIILMIGLVVSSLTAFERISIEGQNKTVDITVDYLEIEKLAKQSDHDMKWWFSQFKDMGIRSVALNEESFETLLEEKKPIRLEIVGNILGALNWQEKYPKSVVDYLNSTDVDDYDMVVTTNDQGLYQFIKSALDDRYDPKKIKLFSEDNTYVFVLDGDIKDALFTQKRTLIDQESKPYKEETLLFGSQLMRLSLGLDPEKVNIVKASGLEVLPRPYNYQSWSGKDYVKAVLADYERLGLNPKYMIFGGKQVLGYPGAVGMTESYMKKNDVKLGLIESTVQREHIKQDGLEELARSLDYNSVRIFSVPPYIQKRFKFYNYEGAEEIENTLYRAITERNIRLIYFRPFMKDDRVYITDIKEYEKTFDSLKARIAEHGMTLGQASVMTPNRLNIWKKITIGWGIAAGVVLLISNFIVLNNKFKYGLLSIGMIGVTGMCYVLPSWADKILALTAAVVFPSLSMVYLFKRCRQYFDNKDKNPDLLRGLLIGIKDLILTSAISFMGALFVGSTLSDIEYLLEMDIFRGVKVAQLLPIVVFGLIYIIYFGYKRKPGEKMKSQLPIADIKRLLFDDIKIIYVVAGAIVLAAGYIYIARTGHETNIQPSTFEMITRNLLEVKLLARPRTKEFLIAFPAIIVAVYAARHRYRTIMFLAGLAGIIGQTSIVNTFSHLRTPMYLSVIRTIYALGFGILLGVGYVVVLEIGIRLLRLVRGEKLHG